jgi:hypothetical protein
MTTDCGLFPLPDRITEHILRYFQRTAKAAYYDQEPSGDPKGVQNHIVILLGVRTHV